MTGGNTLDRLYHYTDLNGLLNILQSDSMELCEQASVCDIRKCASLLMTVCGYMGSIE